jgi:hypothetical protein
VPGRIQVPGSGAGFACGAGSGCRLRRPLRSVVGLRTHAERSREAGGVAGCPRIRTRPRTLRRARGRSFDFFDFGLRRFYGDWRRLWNARVERVRSRMRPCRGVRAAGPRPFLQPICEPRGGQFMLATRAFPPLASPVCLELRTARAASTCRGSRVARCRAWSRFALTGARAQRGRVAAARASADE